MRLNRHLGIEPRFLPLEFALLCANPLVLYQFWSGHADTLFAALVLAAFVLTDIIVQDRQRDSRALIPLLGVVIYAAILTKLYGFILLIACPAYLVLRLRPFFRESTRLCSKLTLSVITFTVLGAAIVLARLGGNPTLDFAVDESRSFGAGYSGYVSGLTEPSTTLLLDGLGAFLFALVLCFHIALLFLLKRGALAWPLAPASFGIILLVGLLPFDATFRNIRYFVPLLPFVVAAIVKGVQRTKSGRPRRAIIVAYLALAVFLALNYNVKSVHRQLAAFNDRVMDPLVFSWSASDNLRLDQHILLERKIDRINSEVESEGALYWLSSYYGTSTWGVIGQLGLRTDIDVRPVRRLAEIPSLERTVHLAGYSRVRLSRLADRLSIRPLGNGVFRLSPLRVELIVEDHPFAVGTPVVLRAEVFSPVTAPELRVELLIDGRPVATRTELPFETYWTPPQDGRFVASATAADRVGNTAVSAAVPVYIGIPALERSVTRSADDAEEAADGTLDLDSTDLDLVEDDGPRIVGLRFSDIRVPRGSAIREAYIQFTVDEVDTVPSDLIVRAQLSGDAPAFKDAGHDISSRQGTSGSVNWSPEPWTSRRESSLAQRTPDLAALVAEVVALPEWDNGNALVFIISGLGRRVADSYDGYGFLNATPRLFIEVDEAPAD